jgi:hypothetical protein
MQRLKISRDAYSGPPGRASLPLPSVQKEVHRWKKSWLMPTTRQWDESTAAIPEWGGRLRVWNLFQTGKFRRSEVSAHSGTGIALVILSPAEFIPVWH